MLKKDEHFETKAHDLSGRASLDLNTNDFNLFASALAGYNPDRFDAAALKVFTQKGELIVTIYAVDKMIQEKNDYPKNKLPVRKFKKKLSWYQFIKGIKSFDAVLSNDAYDIQDILVMNK